MSPADDAEYKACFDKKFVNQPYQPSATYKSQDDNSVTGCLYKVEVFSTFCFFFPKINAILDCIVCYVIKNIGFVIRAFLITLLFLGCIFSYIFSCNLWLCASAAAIFLPFLIYKPRPVLTYYLWAQNPVERLPSIPATNGSSEDGGLFIVRKVSLNDARFLIPSRTFLHHYDHHDWMNSNLGFKGFKHEVNKSIHADTQTLLWSLARISLKRLLVEPPKLSEHEETPSNRAEKVKLFLPVNLHFTYLRIYAGIILLVVVYGVFNCFEQSKLDKQVKQTPQSSAHITCITKSYNYESPLQFCSNIKQENKVKDLAAIQYAVIKHWQPYSLGVLGLFLLALFAFYGRPKSMRKLKQWHDAVIGIPPNLPVTFMLRKDLPVELQWEELNHEDFESKIDEFGPDDEKVLHFAEAGLLVLLLEVIHLSH